eukprot:1194808-Prorocentrum_minimum.AAC.7
MGCSIAAHVGRWSSPCRKLVSDCDKYVGKRCLALWGCQCCLDCKASLPRQRPGKSPSRRRRLSSERSARSLSSSRIREPPRAANGPCLGESPLKLELSNTRRCSSDLAQSQSHGCARQAVAIANKLRCRLFQ